MSRSSRPPKTPKQARSPKASAVEEPPRAGAVEEPPRAGDEPPRRPSVEVRVKPGERPGSEVHEIEYDDDPPPAPAPEAAPVSPPPTPRKSPAPTADPYPEHESTKQGIGLAEQVRQTMPTLPPTKVRGAVKRSDTQDFDKPSAPPDIQAHLPHAWADEQDDEVRNPLRNTNSGLGVPSPSLGSDTDFDPLAMGAAPGRKTGTPSTDIDLGLELKVGGDDDAPDSDSRDALDLVGRNPASSIVPPEPTEKVDPLAELRERYALGDFSGALAIAEDILGGDPDNVDAQRYAESCRDVLRQMYAARLGPMDQIPVVAIPTEQLRWLTLDHRSGFLLSHVDGVSTLEEILDVSGMNPLEAMRIIYDLLQQKVIALQ
jgi:hypothetical protein